MNPATTNEKSAIKTFHTPEKVQHLVPNLQAESRERYVVEWGGRVTDGALVFHFFPPLNQQGALGKWGNSDMDKRLEKSIPEVFDTNRITAGFESDWDSFFIIAGGYASVLSPRMLVKKFLDAIDAD
jgi:hypothetical protein